MADELLASPDDVRDAERTLDGFDTVDNSPEPGDEDQAQKKPKRKRKPRKAR
jgi:hypothetical protein